MIGSRQRRRAPIFTSVFHSWSPSYFPVDVSVRVQVNIGQYTYVHRYFSSTRANLKGSKHLRDKFKDPLSPFYLAPGELGPESPDPVPSSATEQQCYESAAAEAKRGLVHMGYHPDTFYEQKVVWGDLDSFQCAYFMRLLEGQLLNCIRHVNNVRYGESDCS